VSGRAWARQLRRCLVGCSPEAQRIVQVLRRVGPVHCATGEGSMTCLWLLPAAEVPSRKLDVVG